MSELYTISSLMLKISGPVMLASLVLMYIAVAGGAAGKTNPKEVLYRYVRQSVQRKRHAGIFTYMLVFSFIIFVLSILGLIVSGLHF